LKSIDSAFLFSVLLWLLNSGTLHWPGYVAVLHCRGSDGVHHNSSCHLLVRTGVTAWHHNIVTHHKNRGHVNSACYNHFGVLCGSSETTAGSCFMMQNLTTMLGTPCLWAFNCYRTREFPLVSFALLWMNGVYRDIWYFGWNFTSVLWYCKT
jgi:hypothetical protein